MDERCPICREYLSDDESWEHEEKDVEMMKKLFQTLSG